MPIEIKLLEQNKRKNPIMSIKTQNIPISLHFSHKCKDCQIKGIEQNGNLICPQCQKPIITRWNFQGIGFAELGHTEEIELPIQYTFSGVIEERVYSFKLWHWELNLSLEDLSNFNGDLNDRPFRNNTYKTESEFILNNNGYHIIPDFQLSQKPENITFNKDKYLPISDPKFFFDWLNHKVNILNDPKAIEEDFNAWYKIQKAKNESQNSGSSTNSEYCTVECCLGILFVVYVLLSTLYTYNPWIFLTIILIIVSFIVYGCLSSNKEEQKKLDEFKQKYYRCFTKLQELCTKDSNSILKSRSTEVITTKPSKPNEFLTDANLGNSIFTKPMLGKIIKLIKVSDEILIDHVAQLVNLSVATVVEQFTEWAEKFGFRINKNTIILSQGDVQGFIEFLNTFLNELHD